MEEVQQSYCMAHAGLPPIIIERSLALLRIPALLF